MAQDDRFVDYRTQVALVVDDYPSMRSAFKMALASFGMTKVDLASSAAEAILRVKGGRHDVVICDYNLGEGRDGQQLLEEMRYRGLIGLQTAFLMVTAETVYERVVAAAELAPDDYLIKPFSGELLRTRLDAILLRKEAFREAYRRFESGALEAALAGCDAIMKQYPKYLVDALRFKGEVLIAMGDPAGAEALYRQVIALRAVPWSRLGLARALHQQRKSLDAEDLLLDLLRQHPELVAGYDLLADVQVAQNKLQAAQTTLHRAVEVSAKSPRRQRRLGQIAYQNQDLDSAREAFRNAIDKGLNSIFLGANDFANLARVHLDQKDPKAATDLVTHHRKLLQESREGQMVAAVVQAQAAVQSGQAQAQVALEEAIQCKRRGARYEPELALDMVAACLALGQEDLAAELLDEVARNAHDSPALLDKARLIYTQAGKAEGVAKILQKSTAAVARLSQEGALLLQKGELAQGVEKMLQASREAPRNPRVLMNTVWGLLRLIRQEGDSGDRLRTARRLLDNATHLVPDHPRLAELNTLMRNV